MFSQGGLSLEQAPPISVVLRFFITGGIFGVILSLFILFNSFYQLPLFSSHIILVHLLGLGVMASFMLGAMFQMLPVIAGVVIKTPTKKALVAHILLSVGVLLQIGAFSTSNSYLYLFASIILGGGLLHASTLMFKELIKIKDHSSSSKGMLFAISSFIITILLGIVMLLTLGGYLDMPYLLELKEIHYSFAIFGWVTLLIIAISFQVIEMFFVTPKYPNIMTKYLIISLFILLVIKSILIFSSIETILIDIVISSLLIIYAGVTLHRLYRRRRPTADGSVWFWRFGMGLLIVSLSTFFIDNLRAITYISFIGFALSIVFAMVYKIVPFLVWFHLSNQGYMEAPMMHDVIHPKRVKIHFFIHLALFTLLIINSFFNFLIVYIISNIVLTLSFSWILYHIVMANRKYYHIQRSFTPIKW